MKGIASLIGLVLIVMMAISACTGGVNGTDCPAFAGMTSTGTSA